MFNKWLKLPAHLYLRITALTILTVGIALSKVLMSIGAIWIISNWLIQADFPKYWEKFKEKKSAWIVVTLFLFFALSLFWSTNLQFGLKDLLDKLPFLVIPLVMATSEPLEKKHFYFLLYVFLGIILYTSIYNYIHYNYAIEERNDIRSMSVFISHVRFSVLVNLAFFTCLFLIYKKKLNIFFLVLLGIWFLFYIYKSQIINGYILFLILSVFAFFFFVNTLKSIHIKRGIYALFFLATIAVGIVFVRGFEKLNTCQEVDFDALDKYTVNNNSYDHDTTIKERENGHYIWLYVNQEELKNEWFLRSEIPYDSLDNMGQPMFGTIMRYLTSKDIRKDSAGLHSLTNQEIKNIENGHTSIEINKGIITRMNTFFMEYHLYENGGDPNGHSLLQRIEHIKAAVGLIETNWFIGVGSGDVAQEFKNQYRKTNSKLSEEIQYLSHNQFLTVWVNLGIFGFLLFISLFIIPFFEVRKKNFFVYMVLIALTVSCLFQDMIETQAGITIFALFYSLALYREKSDVDEMG